MAHITDVHEDTSSDLSGFLVCEVASDGHRTCLLRVLTCPRIRSCMPEWEGHQDQIRERRLLAASLVACVPSSPSPFDESEVVVVCRVLESGIIRRSWGGL